MTDTQTPTKRGRGRPRQEHPAERKFLGVTIPYFAYARLIEDDLYTLRNPFPVDSWLQVPMRWYWRKQLTYKWVTSLFTQTDADLEQAAAACRQSVQFLVEQLRQDKVARDALSDTDLPDPDVEVYQPLPHDERLAVRKALVQAVRKLWVLTGVQMSRTEQAEQQ